MFPYDPASPTAEKRVGAPWPYGECSPTIRPPNEQSDHVPTVDATLRPGRVGGMFPTIS